MSAVPLVGLRFHSPIPAKKRKGRGEREGEEGGRGEKGARCVVGDRRAILAIMRARRAQYQAAARLAERASCVGVASILSDLSDLSARRGEQLFRLLCVGYLSRCGVCDLQSPRDSDSNVRARTLEGRSPASISSAHGATMPSSRLPVTSRAPPSSRGDRSRPSMPSVRARARGRSSSTSRPPIASAVMASASRTKRS